MIRTKKDLKIYKEYEKKLYYKNNISSLGSILPFALREKDILFKYVCRLRMTEYHVNSGHKFRGFIWNILLHKMNNKYAIHIPINTCDMGLSIAHVGPIIINQNCKIGKDLRIHVGVNIGEKDGFPVIGNNVFIGPGAKIFGAIKIADNCKIGANAVVNKSFTDAGVTLIGVPAHQV